MLTIRLSSMGNLKGDFTQEIPENTTLNDLVEKVLEPLKLQRPAGDVFMVLLNGEIIERSAWTLIKVNPQDHILIAPRITDGETGQIIRSFAVIAITVAVGNWIAGFKLGAVATGLLTASATLTTAWAMNKLIPPPVPEADGLSSTGNDLRESQMYAISGQGNAVKRYATVPKVYGRHRLFPTIAANPYVELMTDRDTNELVQYFYCIYDLGMGPVSISDMRIGDTPITSFDQFNYNIYDTHFVENSPFEWDKVTSGELKFYRGDYQPNNVGVAINKNSNTSSIPGDYEAIRTSADNPDNLDAEITLDFVCASGLYGYNAVGEIGERSISLEVKWRPVGWTDWLPYNDLSWVNNFEGVGGNQHILEPTIPIPQPDLTKTYYTLLRTTPKIYKKISIPSYAEDIIVETWDEDLIYGIPRGIPGYIYAQEDSTLIGSNVQYNGNIIGTITSVGTSPPDLPAGYRKYNFFSLKQNLEFFTYRRTTRVVNGGSPVISGFWVGEFFGAVKNTGILFKKNTLTARFKISRSKTGPAYSTVKFTPKFKGPYEVWVKRIETISTHNVSGSDELTWVTLATRYDRFPLNVSKRHFFLEVKIKATNQLNGSIDNLSVVAHSALDVWTGTAWEKQLTSNPAWIFVDMLTGDINKRAIDKSRLHLPSIVEWANYCDEIPPSPPNYPDSTISRFSCNFIMDYKSTLHQAVTQVTAAGLASLNIIDGKYGVLIDKLRTVPVQIFTPRNSWGFSSQRIYTRKPHGVKVKWIDPAADWIVSEEIVYDDGYTALTATEFDDLQTFGCTNSYQAWRFGRYALAQNRLRQENISLSVDFEHLVCTRGDYVRVVQDVMEVGGTAARVRSVVGNRITIDDGIETLVGPTYGFVFRNSSTGGIVQDSLTVVSSDTFDLDGAVFPSVGDLIVIGVLTQLYLDCLVTSIQPNADLSATLTLIEKADNLYLAESSADIPNYSPQISLNSNTEFVAPGEVENLEVVANTWLFSGSNYTYYVDLDWDVPIGSAYDVFEIFVDSGSGYNIVGTTKETLYRYIVDSTRLGVAHNFKVLAVSATGKKKNLGEVGFVTATPLSKTSAPSNVEALNIDITGEVLQLFWPQVTDSDIKEYLIRYSPNTTSGTWEVSIPLLRIDNNSTLCSTQGRTGIYLIKAVDFNGNESALAASAITTIPELFGLNVLETITDFPSLGGDSYQVDTTGGIMTLQKSVVGTYETTQYYSEGYYYYLNLLDLGEIYTVRLQSLIQAEGFTVADLMSEWPSLDVVTAMSRAAFSDWDVETQYRATETFNSMADWTSLSVVENLSVGGADTWTQWKKFTIGDMTGRIFQFRLRLISNKINVTPRVYDGTIKADMPDRIESYNNLNAPNTGYIVTYSPAFKGPGTTPAIQISINDAASGDYWVIENRTLTGFKITFYDKTDLAVARNFDAVVKGYGRKALAVI